jgi:hypothetical protein
VKREDFEHAVRAAADVVGDDIVVIGSQAVLGQFPNAPASLLRSLEVDVFPRNEPERADEIDGAIGDGSPFYVAYGFYAHGVGPETVHAPAGWEERLVRVELPAVLQSSGTVVAWCLEAHDLVLAKLAAGRQHDYEFAVDALAAGLVGAERLSEAVELMPERFRRITKERLAGVIVRAARADAGT